MGIQIVSLFPETETEQETESVEEMDLVDMLYLFGHAALGLSIQDALEIDPHYRRRLENPI